MWHFETFVSICLRLYRDVWVAPSTSTPRGRTSRMDSAFQRIPIGLVSHVIYFVWYHVMLKFLLVHHKNIFIIFFQYCMQERVGKNHYRSKTRKLTVVLLKGKNFTDVFFFSFQFIRNWNTLKMVWYKLQSFHLRIFVD